MSVYIYIYIPSPDHIAQVQDESSECYAESFEEYAEDDHVQGTTASHGCDGNNDGVHGSTEERMKHSGNDGNKERTRSPLQPQPRVQERSDPERCGSGEKSNGPREISDIRDGISKPSPEISSSQPEMDIPVEVAEGESGGTAPVSGSTVE